MIVANHDPLFNCVAVRSDKVLVYCFSFWQKAKRSSNKLLMRISLYGFIMQFQNCIHAYLLKKGIRL